MQPLSPPLNESQVRQGKITTDFDITTRNPSIEEIKASMWVIFPSMAQCINYRFAKYITLLNFSDIT